MKNPDYLHELIKSLTSIEKRIFKLNSKRHVIGKQNRYVRLFDSINKCTHYDEKIVKEEFGSHSKTNTFASLKSQLYELILVSLRSNNNDNIKSNVENLVKDVEILKNKGLYEQSRRRLHKAKKIAQKYDLLSILLNISYLEREVCLSAKDRKDNSHIEQIIAESSSISSLLENVYFYRNVYDRIYLVVRSDYSGTSKKKINSLEKFTDDPRLQSIDRALSFEAKIYYCLIHAQICVLKGDRSKAIEAYEQQLSLWENNSHQIEYNPNGYLKALANCAGLCFEIGQFDQVHSYLKKIKKIPTRSVYDEIEHFQNRVHIELLLALNDPSYEGHSEWLPKIYYGLGKYSSKLNPSRLLATYYNLLILHFIKGNFQDSLHWLNELLSHRKRQTRNDLVVFAHLLEPVIHYELGNFGLIENLYRNNKRFISQMKELNSIEFELLSVIRRLPSLTSKERRHATLVKLRNNIEIFSETNSDKPVLGLQELIIWLDYKIYDSNSETATKESPAKIDNTIKYNCLPNKQYQYS